MESNFSSHERHVEKHIEELDVVKMEKDINDLFESASSSEARASLLGHLIEIKDQIFFRIKNLNDDVPEEEKEKWEQILSFIQSKIEILQSEALKFKKEKMKEERKREVGERQKKEFAEKTRLRMVKEYFKKEYGSFQKKLEALYKEQYDLQRSVDSLAQLSHWFTTNNKRFVSSILETRRIFVPIGNQNGDAIYGTIELQLFGDDEWNAGVKQRKIFFDSVLSSCDSRKMEQKLDVNSKNIEKILDEARHIKVNLEIFFAEQGWKWSHGESNLEKSALLFLEELLKHVDDAVKGFSRKYVYDPLRDRTHHGITIFIKKT